MQRRIVLGLTSIIHFLNESPIVLSTNPVRRHHSVCAQLTGIPQFVLIPAPVTTTTLLDFPNLSAISCSSWPDPGPTLMVGILAA